MMGLTQQEAQNSSMGPDSIRSFSSGGPASLCVPIGRSELLLRRIWLKHLHSTILGQMDRGTQVLKEENILGFHYQTTV